MASTTEVKKCSCKHEGQDKIYGNGNRLFNQNSKKEFMCTVCGSKMK